MVYLSLIVGQLDIIKVYLNNSLYKNKNFLYNKDKKIIS